MDGSTQALLSIIISGTALVISLLSVLRTRKNHLSGILSSQRLVWAENLRIAVSTFITAMYEGENLAPYRARVFLYLSPINPKHKRLIDAIDQIYRPSNGTVSLEENCNLGRRSTRCSAKKLVDGKIRIGPPQIRGVSTRRKG